MIVLNATPELKLTFEKLIQTMEAQVSWNGLFVVIDNTLILQGDVRSLFFHFDSRKVVTNIIDLDIQVQQITPIENNDYVKKVEELGLRMDDTQTMLMRPKKPFPENLIIPDGVKSINKEVFRSFPKLETVIMPDSIESIGDYVFCGSRKLRKVKLSNALKDTGKFTFLDCHALEEVILPSALEKIGCSAFENCSSLKSITIPESVTVIDDYAFANCTGLESIVIPASVKYIAYRAFKGCSKLKNVKILNKDIVFGLEVFDK